MALMSLATFPVSIRQKRKDSQETEFQFSRAANLELD